MSVESQVSGVCNQVDIGPFPESEGNVMLEGR